MTEVISATLNKSICIKCGGLKSNNGIRKGICGNCRLKIRIENSPMIDCECGHPDCKEKVHSIGSHKGIKRLAPRHRFLTEKFRKQYDMIRGEKHVRWKGGWYKDEDGYYHIYKPDHPYNVNKYVMNHRLIYEHYLKILFDEDIYIPRGIDVHHIIPIDEGGTDTLINLTPMTKSAHMSHHRKKDHTYTRCSDPKCKHPDRTEVDRRPERHGLPKWYSDGNGGYWCKTCYERNMNRKRRNSLKNRDL
jgi:hypothetical protein